jgi:hypothetical protein
MRDYGFLIVSLPMSRALLSGKNQAWVGGFDSPSRAGLAAGLASPHELWTGAGDSEGVFDRSGSTKYRAPPRGSVHVPPQDKIRSSQDEM